MDNLTDIETNHKMVLLIMQLTTLYNAVQLGWKVKKINKNGFTMTKKINEMTLLDHNIKQLIDLLIKIR